LQTLALCWARSIEVWIFFSIFPFLPAFVQRTGVPQPEIGYYVGIVESIFALTQFAAMMVWSGWSDRYGRKPVLCTCLVGASLSAFVFGLSTKIWHMLILRALAGVFSASAT
jgi:MFS family permease